MQNFIWGIEKTREWSNLNQFSKLPLLDIYYKKSAHSLFGAWSFLLVHIRVTPSERPKDFVYCFLKTSDHGSWTMKSNHGRMPSSMVRLHSPWWKPSIWASEPTHALVPCWMPKPLPPRNQCTGWFAPTINRPSPASNDRGEPAISYR